jgi:hypothetical protein
MLYKGHINILQNPVSSPTAKQLASWLKEADKATGLLEFSITGLVFIFRGSEGVEALLEVGFDGTMRVRRCAHLTLLFRPCLLCGRAYKSVKVTDTSRLSNDVAEANAAKNHQPLSPVLLQRPRNQRSSTRRREQILMKWLDVLLPS